MNAQEVYKAAVGNSHEAAVEAVYQAGYDAGVAAAQAALVTTPADDPAAPQPGV